MKKYLSHIISAIITLVLSIIMYYIFIPPINLTSGDFWFFIIMVFIIATVVSGFGQFVQIFARATYSSRGFKSKKKKPAKVNYRDLGTFTKVSSLIALGIVALMIIFSFFSSKLINAKAYSKILQVEEGEISDLPSVSNTSAIALMDTDSAKKLGDREIGTLSSVVSQYDIEDDSYTQLNVHTSPVKVAPLSYASFFKWINNKNNGVPGYVVVDPVTMDANYTELSEGMIYVPSAFFSEDLERHIRMKYLTTIFDTPHFEVDEEGNPWYVAPVIKKTIGLFGGKKLTGAILVNPITGEMTKYKLSDVPSWVDVVYGGNYIAEQYNNYAQLQKGFLNSVIGQNGCRKVTEDSEESTSDYGYIAIGDDIYIYTGVTSVNGDSSNIGFIIANERTGQTKFIEASGADEFSAMNAAEGEVQEKGYEASFPSLITIDDIPTYIMVLKDKSGLVKMYACVNVSQYNIVATATTQEKCIENYKNLLSGNISLDEANNDSSEATTSETIDESLYTETEITITKMQTIDNNGNTYLYIVDQNNNIYNAKYTDVLDMLLVNVGDTVKLRIYEDKFLMAE